MLKPAEALVAFGFNALESEVYAALLANGSSTGYRVASIIQKPAANTYKALEALERKGAVNQDGSQKRVYEAVPAKVLLSRLERQFTKNSTTALSALESLGISKSSAKFNAITSIEHAATVASALIASAQQTVVFVASQAYGSLFSDLSHVAEVAGLAVSVGSQTGVDLITEDAFEHATLELVVDRHSALIYTQNQGFFIENHPIAATMHQAVVCQVGLYRVDRKLEEDAGKKAISRVIETLP